ncbi:MAG TPA: DUF401 family protein [Candidatus Acidoferrum sp.]|nr:DUF401 family protein [Candidatus Acidoferrum sp.]
MDMLKLAGVFACMIVILRLKKPLYVAAIACTLLTIVLFGFTPQLAATTLGAALVRAKSWRVIAIIYMMSLLQVMMNSRKMFETARSALVGLSNRLRVNVAVIPIFMGILPTPGSVLIAAPMIDEDCKEYLTKDEKTFITSFYRHIPETWLPTYSSVILALELSGVPVAQYMLYMLPVVFMMLAVPYVIYLRKLPKTTGIDMSENKARELGRLFKGLWSILLLIFMILVLEISVQTSTLVVLVLLAVAGKFSFGELAGQAKEAVNMKMLISTYTVLIFSSVLGAAGVMERLPATFESLPIPAWLTFALLFFFGSIVGGVDAIVVMVLPLAFATVPNAGAPLLMLLMTFGHMAMQLTPIHICLTLASEFFGTTLQSLMARTLPVAAVVAGFASLFYLLLTLF